MNIRAFLAFSSGGTTTSVLTPLGCRGLQGSVKRRTSLLLALALICLFNSAAYADALGVLRLLSKPKVRFVAVAYSAVPVDGRDLGRLGRRFADQGVLFRQVEGHRGCKAQKRRYFQVVCDSSGVIRQQLALGAGEGGYYLWDWRGELKSQSESLLTLSGDIQEALKIPPSLNLQIDPLPKAAAIGPGILEIHLKRALSQLSQLTLTKVSGNYRKPQFDCSPGHSFGGTLRAYFSNDGRTLHLGVASPSDCWLAQVHGPWSRSQPQQIIKELSKKLVQQLRRSIQWPSASRVRAVKSDIPAATNQYAADDPAHAERRISLGKLDKISPKYRKFAEKWVGTRYRLGADGSEGAIDGPHLARAFFKEVYGRPMTSKIKKMYKIGPPISFDETAPDLSLQPGDLLYMVTFAAIPRSVMIYLGNGKTIKAARIRGVVVDSVPKNLPEYLYLVARRPLAEL